MSPQTPTHRRTTTAAISAGFLVVPLFAFAPAVQAAPCQNTGAQKPRFGCNPTGTRPGSPGGGSGGTSGGSSGPWMPPAPEGLTADEAQDIVPVDGGPPPAAAAPPSAALAEQAFTERGFPLVKVHTAPDGKTYVRVRTSLWVEGFDTLTTDPVSAGDQTVQATARPMSVEWNLGEKKIVCEDAGTKDGRTCNYTYQRSSTGQPGGSYKITATITWRLGWTCEGGGCDAPSGVLDNQAVTSQPTPLVVSEIQTNTGQ
ncbi:hypothetical protein [Actinomadura sp. 7K534]|uniref:hypothetical protein n=1 Tax=Actinomadura sp. 7K534 TaxID=2530366 RepID=UPI0010498CC9|nr:hypothetical protein [Actinomadura sp. 7K534]TDB97196.1 hypothetical protein E1266_07235 [Actinomadura sp. 7K534]